MVSESLRIVSEKPIIGYSRRDFPRIDKDETLVQAFRLMEKYEADAVIVTDNKEPVGIMGRRDIIDKLVVERTRRVTASRLHVSSFMKELLYFASEDTTVSEASRIILSERIPGLPVRVERKIIAVFMPRDTPKILMGVDDLEVAEVMGPPKYIARYGDRVIHLRQKFIEMDIEFAPVVDYEGRIKGVVGIDEIAGSLIVFHEEIEEKYRKEKRQKLNVEDIMRRSYASVSPTDSLAIASKVIIDKKTLGAIVLDEDRIVGVLSIQDLLRSLTLA